MSDHAQTEAKRPFQPEIPGRGLLWGWRAIRATSRSYV
jgi:hypothetical protein